MVAKIFMVQSMKENTQKRVHPPIGNLLLRTLAMPGDTNPAGDILVVGSCLRWIYLEPS